MGCGTSHPSVSRRNHSDAATVVVQQQQDDGDNDNDDDDDDLALPAPLPFMSTTAMRSVQNSTAFYGRDIGGVGGGGEVSGLPSVVSSITSALMSVDEATAAAALTSIGSERMIVDSSFKPHNLKHNLKRAPLRAKNPLPSSSPPRGGFGFSATSTASSQLLQQQQSQEGGIFSLVRTVQTDDVDAGGLLVRDSAGDDGAGEAGGALSSAADWDGCMSSFAKMGCGGGGPHGASFASSFGGASAFEASRGHVSQLTVNGVSTGVPPLLSSFQEEGDEALGSSRRDPYSPDRSASRSGQQHEELLRHLEGDTASTSSSLGALYCPPATQHDASMWLLPSSAKGPRLQQTSSLARRSVSRLSAHPLSSVGCCLAAPVDLYFTARPDSQAPTLKDFSSCRDFPSCSSFGPMPCVSDVPLATASAPHHRCNAAEVEGVEGSAIPPSSILALVRFKSLNL